MIPTSTSAGPSIHRPELEIDGRPTRLLVDQIRSIDTDYVVGDPVDYLNRDELAEVDLALAHYLGVQDAAPAPLMQVVARWSSSVLMIGSRLHRCSSTRDASSDMVGPADGRGDLALLQQRPLRLSGTKD